MSFIGRGECRNCGCGEYVKPLDGQKCYHCNHDVDVHLVKYKPQTTTSTPTRKTHSLSVQNTMDGATIDVSQMHSGETFKQGAPDICFEETRQVREPYVRTQGHFVKPQDKVSIISKQISSVTRKDEDAGHSEGNTPPIAAQRSIGAVPEREESSPVSKSRKSLPRTPMKASDVFVATAPYNGPKPSCWRLRMSHLAYGTEPPERLCGSYKIAENGRTIYVGNAESASIRRALRRHFRGMEKQNIGAYLTTLDEEYKDKFITVFWLGSEIKHDCKCSYLKCFERMEGKKPQYNMQGHSYTSRPKREGSRVTPDPYNREIITPLVVEELGILQEDLKVE
ncbi:uncharacterized protein [Haliotis asinina]|uniref:uncharacterized protein isoform X1 n=1 Tax=Haliotis asinina TaxID=109174 RepID=UPI0035321090